MLRITYFTFCIFKYLKYWIYIVCFREEVTKGILQKLIYKINNWMKTEEIKVILLFSAELSSISTKQLQTLWRARASADADIVIAYHPVTINKLVCSIIKSIEY